MQPAVITPAQAYAGSQTSLLQPAVAGTGALQGDNGSGTMTLQPVAPIATLQNGNLVSGGSSAPSYSGYGGTNYSSSGQAAASNTIGNGYDNVLNVLNGLVGQIPGQQAVANQMVNDQANAQQKSAQSNYDRGVDNLNFSRGVLSNQTTRSLRQLGAQIQNTFNSYDQSLGAQGAGDSSATGPNGMLSYALQTDENLNRGNILQDDANQRGAIDMKQKDLQAQMDDAMNQLATWKNNQILSVAQQFQNQLNALNTQRALYGGQKGAALASLNTNLVNDALNNLASIEAQHQAMVNSIQSGVQGYQGPDTRALAQVNYNVNASPQSQVHAMQVGNPSDATANQGAIAAIPPQKQQQDPTQLVGATA